MQRLSAKRKSLGSDALKGANMSERDWADEKADQVTREIVDYIVGGDDERASAIIATALRTAHKVPEGCVRVGDDDFKIASDMTIVRRTLTIEPQAALAARGEGK